MVAAETAFAASLVQQLQHPQLTVRIHAGILLAEMGAQARPALPALTELLGSDDPPDRRLAAMTLGALACEIVETLPLLLHAQSDKDATVRRFAAQALEAIEPTGTPRQVA